MASQVKTVYDVLVRDWCEDHQYMVAGFRDDLFDIAQWLCYCTKYQPVQYSFYHSMQCSRVPLPRFEEKDVLDAWDKYMSNAPKAEKGRELIQTMFANQTAGNTSNAAKRP